jgi:hypothetical protein
VHVRLRSANLDECFALLLSRQVEIAIVFRLPGEDHPISDRFRRDDGDRQRPAGAGGRRPGH